MPIGSGWVKLEFAYRPSVTSSTMRYIAPRPRDQETKRVDVGQPHCAPVPNNRNGINFRGVTKMVNGRYLAAI
jgi:hypothetical protein